ncbi:hypothetical protein INT45_009006 [Circinella minor]|uniref:Uncharacterized protein n=1 Tax=Circinella minor TaxID=1195481 RepID=A0A8H7V6Z4_9FUNG|nr:hypothetical protein INT45_009006 [Circinella minor]
MACYQFLGILGYCNSYWGI